MAERLAVSIYNGPSMTTLGELSDGIGGRLTGSPAYVRSTEWAGGEVSERTVSRMCGWIRSRFDAGWQRQGRRAGRCVAPSPRALHLASLGWCPVDARGEVWRARS